MKKSSSVYIFMLTFVISVSCKKDRNLSEKVELFAVTNFPDIRAFYNLVKKQKELVRPKWLDADIQKNICQNIFNSHYFQLNIQDEWIDINDDEIRKQLTTDPRTADSVFKLRKSTRKRFMNPVEYVHNDNDVYRDLPIYSNDNREDEYFFKCLSRNPESRELKEYFISREYNVATKSYPIAGRFVFSPHPTMFLVIRALAEEVARGLKTSEYGLIEYHYSKRRKNNGPTKLSEQDPVCKLEPMDKLRLCAVLLGSVTFREKVQFSPSIENVKPDCEQKQISFRANISTPANLLLQFTGRQFQKQRNYEEWLIGCNTMTADRKNKMYFVSRGYEENTVFLYSYKFSDDRIFVRDFFKHVGVVGGVLEKDVQLDT